MKFMREMELFWEEIQSRPLGPGGHGPAGPTTDLTGGVGRAAKLSGRTQYAELMWALEGKGEYWQGPQGFPK